MDYKTFDHRSQSTWNRKMYDDIIQTAVRRLHEINGEIIPFSNLDVLDVGAGSGGLSLALLRFFRVRSITLLDLRQEGLKMAKERIEKEHPDVISEYIISDVCDIPKDTNSYDLVISRGSFRFWEKQSQALMEIRRVMKKGALFYIGGGRGSRSFQKIRETEGGFIEKNEQFHSMEVLKKLESHVLSDTHYERIFAQQKDRFRIYHSDGDGHWLVMKKEGLKDV